ncbi:MAG: hypothetical protein ACYSWX_07420 [Planctomycetota bacterium]|jgi:hypothetical protein
MDQPNRKEQRTDVLQPQPRQVEVSGSGLQGSDSIDTDGPLRRRSGRPDDSNGPLPTQLNPIP